MKPTCKWINQRGIQCGQPEGHRFTHGNGTLTTPRDTWHLPDSPSNDQIETTIGQLAGGKRVGP